MLNVILVGNYKQKYNLESNSQHIISRLPKFNVGNYKQKYNLESNSQQSVLLFIPSVCWEL